MNDSIVRRNTKQIALGTVRIGNGAPVAVQSMCTTDTRDPKATLEQIKRLEEAGCEIVRLAVPDEDDSGAGEHAIRQTSPAIAATQRKLS